MIDRIIHRFHVSAVFVNDGKFWKHMINSLNMQSVARRRRERSGLEDFEVL